MALRSNTRIRTFDSRSALAACNQDRAPVALGVVTPPRPPARSPVTCGDSPPVRAIVAHMIDVRLGGVDRIEGVRYRHGLHVLIYHLYRTQRAYTTQHPKRSSLHTPCQIVVPPPGLRWLSKSRVLDHVGDYRSHPDQYRNHKDANGEPVV